MRLLLAALMLVALASGCGGTSEATQPDTATRASTTQAKPKPPPEPTKPTRYGKLLKDGLTPEAAAKTACATYAQAIDEWTERAERYLADSADVLDRYEPMYEAQNFEYEHGPFTWGTPASFEREIRRLGRRGLAAVTLPRVVAGTTPQAAGFLPTTAAVLQQKFTADSLFVCRLGASVAATKDVLRAANARSDEINRLAALVPWYPPGWFEESDGVAFEWVQDNKCGYESAYCWGITVVSRDGCPNGVYAELNILDGDGTVIDYANDSLGSLDSQQRGRLDFTSFERGYGELKATVTEIRCS
jgi:hypothetical protein